MAMSPGTIVGGYRIQRVLGAGGMGTVYLAKHPSLPRMDALKVLSGHLSADNEFRARFEREANLAAGLDHANIVSVYNRGEEDGQLWIAMQYVDGTDAAAELERDPRSMTPQRALRIVTEVGKGLDYAHRRGLLHRDVKPANFLLSAEQDEEERVLLTDFGVAKSSEDTTDLTQTGSFVATIAYAPPEQLSGGRLDHRADIYSLACAFYKLLTGQNPYPATQPAMVMMGHLHEPPPRATAVNRNLPPAIDQVFARALAKNPAERFNTCREFTDAATQVLSGGIPQAPGPFGYASGSHPTATGAIGYTSGPQPHAQEPSWPRYAVNNTAEQTRPPTDPRAHLSALDQLSHPQSAPSGRNRLLGAAAAVVVVALAAGIGIWALSGGDTPAGTNGTSAVAVAPGSIEEARKNNPAFEGKAVTVVDVTGGKAYDNQLAMYLTPGDQAKFLQDLGFAFNSAFTNSGSEPSPRPVTKEDRYTTFSKINSGYLIAIRSDEGAGGGGLSGLNPYVNDVTATVIVVDDPATVNAFRNWTSSSQPLLLEKLVPILRAQVK
ncbi:serine/threonine protein kinase [Nocardia cyriacigeorgica]|uniref:non-specific serine/threonine protein kinase n=1 Tax=Nocardia cyriacigeorgica TaxID=135487 RepID=A0ABX0CLE2_9NOCA|nr:serine/threonine-protein kinase [Nocardia cyriacigeorgica]NEW52732.1 serine/threonine protein kinase [Nocardia cyriacigeorgica]NEW57340.1 serine/threonine protein kinase [Nocardia cyriacigeorgica]